MAKESRRFWLTFAAEDAKRPLIWELSQKFDLVFNIRDSAIRDGVGLVALELTGTRSSIDKAIQWLRRRKVQVDPIELAVVES